MAAPHCASSSSAFLGLPRSDDGRRYGNSCRFASTTRLATVSATLDKETAAAKPRRTRNRRPRKATKSGSTALLAPDEPAEAKNGGATEAPNGGLGGSRGMVALDDVIVNPVGLGRRSRQVFDEVWRKFSRLGQMSSAASAAVAEQDPAVLFRGGPMCDFTVPGAQDTTVLVVGAIGRIVVRKLMLRGYNVKVLLFSSPNWLIFSYTVSMAVTLTDAMGPLAFIFFCFVSVGGNGRSYVIILETGPLADTSQSKKYFARMNTKVGFCRVRVPFSSFHPVNPQDPPLDPFLVHTLTIRFEPKKQRPGDSSEGASDQRNFELKMEFIKALPSGQETDIVLVSCTGSGIEANRREQVLKAKKAGEDALRRSGLGYTIVRPGPLQEEPGGQRTLIFDQGNRISQGISCADVADICVKALHDSTARNKSFDVCYEHVSEQGSELYELVAHLPDKANNYLAPALSVLEKNT
ncbi:unnamed protein product [Miscanthus lutarioriparius]|uniref:NAD(P)-binding domain-containing protein n=1 Tax=Miscanthus lutarioriparius TaxID=422564 RepID=A0A811PL46_9POAL|nr:unnamed protein product [Miscanthus lutarioriparius]